jgi:hypothetical protein
MAKLTGKQLYGTWLDIYYANQLNEAFVHDLEIEFKEARKWRNKTQLALKKAAKHYKKLYKKEPKLCK